MQDPPLVRRSNIGVPNPLTKDRVIWAEPVRSESRILSGRTIGDGLLILECDPPSVSSSTNTFAMLAPNLPKLG